MELLTGNAEDNTELKSKLSVTTMELLQFKGAVIGTVMGDGCLRKYGCLECSSTSKEYLEWKKEFLEELTEVKIRRDDKYD